MAYKLNAKAYVYDDIWFKAHRADIILPWKLATYAMKITIQ